MPAGRHRRLRIWRAGWFAIAALLVPGHAAATNIRASEHAGIGRVVITLPARVVDSATQQGDRLILHLPGAGAVPGIARGAGRVNRIDGGQDQAVLELAPGSHTRIRHTRGRVVVDIFGPATAGAPAQLGEVSPGVAATAVHAAPLPEITLVPMDQPAPKIVKSDTVAAAAPVSAAPAPATVPLPATATAPAPGEPVAGAAPDALVAERLPDGKELGEASILVPFDRMVSAAAFPRGSLAHVVFNDGKPLDLAGLKDDKVFGSARVTLLPAATHLSLLMPAGARLRLRRQPEGWVITVAPAGPAEPSAAIALDKGAMAIAMPFAADTVVMNDPATGGRLLVGTVLGDGPGVAVPHLSPEFSVLPSWAGVVVAAASDRLSLRTGKASFNLSNGSKLGLAAQLAEASGSAAEAAALTRHFDLPPLPTPALLTRLRADLHAAGSAPKMARLSQRLQAAQAMLSLGLDREAGGLLRTAQQDDPASGGGADAAALLAMADWLAGGDGGKALDDPALGKSDEVALWRALTAPAAADRRAAGAALAATWRLLLAYPEPLQRRLVRPAVETMLQGGQIDAGEALLSRFANPALDDLRAEVLVQRGRTPEALALLDKISARADRKHAAAAARTAVELRLAKHQIAPADAASVLEKRLYAWRDDATEISQRLRVAELRMQAGKWRQALSLLRETDQLFPDSHDRVRQAELAVIADLLRAGQAQRLTPLDLVALVEESADLLAAKEASETLAPVLVDKLLALDLPDRAEPILAKMMAATGGAEAKAGLGMKLAALRLSNGRTAAALEALDASEAPGLPPELRARRDVLRAKALAASGQAEQALRLLAESADAEGLQLRAQLLEDRKDWRGAENALLALMHATLPPDGKLSAAQQDLVLRAASAASEAGDMAVLQQLQGGDAHRLDPGPRSALFQALAQQPVHSLTDLPRSGREAEAVRAVPAALATLEGR